ncbi:MAG: hypothetical protein R3E66_17840 [bacterium]
MKSSFPKTFVVVMARMVGALIFVVGTDLLSAASSDQVFTLWWTSRALGVLAYLGLWFSVLFGVLVSSRGAGGLLAPGMMIDLHTRWALVAIAATVLHVLMIVGDPKASLVPWQAIVPFASPKARGALGLGSVAMWLLLAVASSTYLFERIPKAVWRAVHALAFGTYLLALSHALMIGSAADEPLMFTVYLATTGILVAALVQRVLLAAVPNPTKHSN